ncbi:zinc finger protein 28-like [Drosophila novamexicana]|uniref:zinc finger protein 28-like n=1 Tax=Drosophila novamexicana TaxID=47314 RepID=UPI0011E5DA7A|nr:zinc finger protein 28-like [Drosophila novamexicana]
MLDRANGKPFRCDQCNYTSNRSFDLRRHQQRHARVKPVEGTVFKCNECSFVTKWKRNMGRHMEKHKKTAVAEDSQLEDETIEEFIVEVIEASEDPEIEEEQAAADQATVTMVLASDKINETPRDKKLKRFKCELCRYTSNRAFDLRRHEQTHFRIKVVDGMAYKCSECHFITKWKRNMRRHMRKHEDPNEEEFTAETNEPEAEEIVVELIDAEALSSDFDMASETQSCSQEWSAPEEIQSEKRYKCDQCEYESKRGYDLRRHAQIHAKAKPLQGIAYQCNECSFITKWKRNMRRHMEKHKPKPIEANVQVDDFVVELKSVEGDHTEKLKSLELEEDPGVLPSYWIALPADDTMYLDTAS